MINTMYAPIRVIIADDHEIFRDGFKVMLKKQTEVEIIAEAENGRELLELAKAHQPDVIITDIKMPLMDGIEATKQIKKDLPHIEVIALTMFDEENLVIDMLEAGAKGYLLKNTNKAEVVQAVKAVYRQETYYCNSTSNKLAQMIAKSRFNPYKSIPKPSFNEKEIEIIRLICKELSNKEIASELGLSTRTIEGYREKILEKIDAKNIAGLVIYAIRNNIYQV
jgi:DNA-binding NarL/FixJ family response regulator